jgi:hypothetical protein
MKNPPQWNSLSFHGAGLNPPLQKGEAVGMPGLIEKLQFNLVPVERLLRVNLKSQMGKSYVF